MDQALAPVIAVVGCDGSGKSTLAADIRSHLGQSREVGSVYLGLGSGAMGNRIKAWPLIGPALEKLLSRRAAQARNPEEKIPGLLTAIVLYRFSLKRKRQFERLLKMRRAGVIAVTDRYPQTDVAGFYDGPGLSAARSGSWLIERLARKERAIYDWMASHTPTLVIRLNIDAETALSRKPDHSRDLIERKVAVTPKLEFNGAAVIDIDAKMDYRQELDIALKAVESALSSAKG